MASGSPQRFRWDERLHARQDFAHAIRRGKRWSSAGLVLWVGQRSSPGFPRMGLAVPRSFGGAPRRNRLKRILREIFRRHKAELRRDVDLVFGARTMDNPLSYASLEPLVLLLWKKASCLI